MEPQFVTKPAFTVVGLRIRAKGGSPEIPQLWDRSVPRMGEIKHGADERSSYGVMGNFDMATGEMDYMAGDPVSDASDLPQGMSAWHVPANTYAVFETTLPEIGETFNHMHTAWLPSLSYRITGAPQFERYGEDFSPDNSQVAIYIPVEEKA